jgi:hypothetical protein
MAIVTVPEDGDPIEIVAAAATRAIVQNVGGFDIVMENAADPTTGISLGPGETLDLGAAWTLAWNAMSPSLKDVPVRVAFEPAP